jgi:ubiquinol-cytochrome c reductase cytochrome c1 subunit
MQKSITSIIFALVLGCSGAAFGAGGVVSLPKQQWSSDGLFGTFDRGALQRGFQVYNEVCAGCHSLRLVAYRNLIDIGFTEDQVKKIAASKTVKDGPNDQGEMFERPGKPSDRFVMPFPNKQAARAANNGAYPPDLSLMVKARMGSSDYLFGLLTGYKDSPKGVKVPEGMYYNQYYPGHLIAMPSPLSDGSVEYADKTKATVNQMAKDVTAFLAWTAEPEMEDRKRIGIKVLLFLIILTGMLYAIKRKIWSDIH